MTTPPLPFPPSAEPERRRTPRLLFLLLVALCIIFVVGYFERLAQLESTRQSVTEMQRQVAASHQRYANLQAERERVQDPYYLALLARDGLGLVQEGDLPVVIYAGPPTPMVTPVANVDSEGTRDKPPWRQWLELILP